MSPFRAYIYLRLANYLFIGSWRRLIKSAFFHVAVLLLLVFGAYVVLVWHDQQVAARYQQMEWKKKADAYSSLLVACLNGKYMGLYYINAQGQRVEIVCDPAWELKV